MNKIIYFSLFFLALGMVSCKPNKTSVGKGTLNFNIEHVFGSSPLELTNNLKYKNAAGNSLKVSSLRYYLSNFVLVNNKGEEIKLNNYELIDIEKSSSLSFKYDNILNGSYQKIRFYIGVDSLANSTGDHTGALDPANGMDWGWNFGYRFFLLEGNYKATDTSAEAGYSYHVGTNPSLMKVELPMVFDLSDNAKSITFKFDMEKMFSQPNQWNIYSNDYNHSSNGSEVAAIAPLRQNIQNTIVISTIK
ncbi:MAG: hypothetical protein HYZ42_18845 [Bacteroidetes bacterium]|nr:hypothetical protein [Bacteroidota bacterium]